MALQNQPAIILLFACFITLASAQTLLNVYDMDATVTAVEQQQESIQNAVSVAIASMQSTATITTNELVRTIAPLAAANLAVQYRRQADIEILAADIQRSAVVDGPAYIAAIQAAVGSRISSEVAFRQAIAANLQATVAAASTTSANALVAASAVRTQLKVTASNNRLVIQSAANVNITAAFSTENSRAIVEGNQMNSQVSSATAALSTALIAAISSEVTRADSTCLARAQAGSSSGGLPQQTGSNDYTSCSSTLTGFMYYSTGSKRVFMCNGARWSALNMFPPAFRDSTVLSRAQASVLTRMLNSGSVWTKCYRGSEDSGFGSSSAATTFHNACNSKGPTVVIAKSTAGRIWGGYTDQPWLSRGGWATSYEAFLWRFNPNAVTTFERASLYNGGGYSNAMYDISSYCPTFGGGHDWQLGSTCKTGYTANGNSYYYASGQAPYDQSWFGGSYSSWVLAELEVYYLYA